MGKDRAVSDKKKVNPWMPESIDNIPTGHYRNPNDYCEFGHIKNKDPIEEPKICDVEHPDKVEIKPGGINVVYSSPQTQQIIRAIDGMWTCVAREEWADAYDYRDKIISLLPCTEESSSSSHAALATEIADLRALLAIEEEKVESLSVKNERLKSKLTSTNIALKNEAEDNARLRRQVSSDDQIDYRLECRRIMGIISDVLAEASENPHRLVAFNSPLLGMLTIEHYAYTQGTMTAGDQRAYDQYKSVHKIRQSQSVVDKVV